MAYEKSYYESRRKELCKRAVSKSQLALKQITEIVGGYWDEQKTINRDIEAIDKITAEFEEQNKKNNPK